MNNKELPLIPFSELKGKTYVIPFQQRGYKWNSTNVEELLNDLKDFIDNSDTKKRIYCLQPFTIVPLGENRYNVLDGQQRLTTLYLLHTYLYHSAPYKFEFERDRAMEGEGMSRSQFLREIDAIDDVSASQCIDFFYIHNAYNHIKVVFNKWAKELCNSDDEKIVDEIKLALIKKFKVLLDGGRKEKSVQIIWYEVKKEKEHETFRNLNSGKIPLTNTELIKALMLNRVSGLPTKEQEEAAVIFEQIEQQLQNDHFWYMFNAGELREGQTRMDFLFNLAAECKQSDYDIDSRWSFRNYFMKPEKGTLSEKWKQVRHTYLRLKDMYDDIYSYHYIGFLTYSNDNTLNSTKDLLELSRNTTHSDFIENLKQRIKQILNNKHHSNVEDYRYDQTKKKDLRLLFVMHNVETILQKYASLNENEKLHLKNGFERFPYELLHKQNWDIEHIASNTDSDFKNTEDRKAWLQSIKKDLGEKYPKQDVSSLEEKFDKDKKKEHFDELYNAIMRRCDEAIEDAIKDNSDNGKDKMQVGNITLLDSHTNRCYHNALFPRKRRYIIVANGLTDKNDKFEQSISKLYVPPCTLSVFTKAYNKGGYLTLNAWTQTDADAYLLDMEQKLSYYYDKSSEK